MNFPEMMNRWLEQNKPASKEPDLEQETVNTVSRKALLRKQLLETAPEKEIDLHGCTACEAITILDRFIAESAARGIKKVLIIHGKGLHSKNGAILQREVRSYIEKNPRCGEFGYAERKTGGKGALWVILR